MNEGYNFKLDKNYIIALGKTMALLRGVFKSHHYTFVLAFPLVLSNWNKQFNKHS